LAVCWKENFCQQDERANSTNRRRYSTIDSSVKISLTALTGKKEVLLSIKDMLKNTNGLEYILSYETVEGGCKVLTVFMEIMGQDFEKKITLGTCSSGTCVYHNIKIK
jgi:hypothetical protein